MEWKVPAQEMGPGCGLREPFPADAVMTSAWIRRARRTISPAERRVKVRSRSLSGWAPFRTRWATR